MMGERVLGAEADLLVDLNEPQREAVRHPGGPLLILAGAGSGKTRVLTRRAAWLIQQGVSPFRILCITFTNKAAREMLERLEALVGPASRDLWACTFHAACARMLRRDAERIGFGRNFIILDTDDQAALIKECLKELNWDDKRWPAGGVAAAISRAKDALVGPEEFQRRARDPRSLQVAEIYKLYQRKLHQNNALDFGDLIMYAVQMLEGDAEARDYYQQRFLHILVDEYQDTNHAQYRLIKLLGGLHRNVTVVGDADQSIYAFRGADITNILNFEADYPEARVIKLEENYRSTQSILDVASQVIARNSMRRERALWTRLGRGEKVRVFQARDEHGEAQYVAEEIQRGRLAEGRRWSDFAVLYRTNAQSRVFEDAFMKRNIPYTVVGGLKFYERKEVKDMIAYLRLIANPRDRLSFQRVINVPRRGIGAATLARLEEYGLRHGLDVAEVLERVEEVPGLGGAQARQLAAFRDLTADFRRQAEFLSVYELIQEVMERTGYRGELLREGDPEALGRVENLEELLSVAREFEAGGGLFPAPGDGVTPLEAFLESVALVADADTYEDAADAVVLMTIHSAKGLEFPVVFLVGMEEGVFPHFRSLEDEAGVEEERRLCYVGMTRARQRLYLTHACERTLYGTFRENEPSRFLEEFDPGLAERSSWCGMEGGGVAAPPVVAGPRQAAGAERGAGSGPAAAAGPCPGDLRPGDRVRHRVWGEGTVVSVRGAGEDAEVAVAFPARGVRTLLARYAPLERM